MVETFGTPFVEKMALFCSFKPHLCQKLPKVMIFTNLKNLSRRFENEDKLFFLIFCFFYSVFIFKQKANQKKIIKKKKKNTCMTNFELQCDWIGESVSFTK